MFSALAYDTFHPPVAQRDNNSSDMEDRYQQCNNITWATIASAGTLGVPNPDLEGHYHTCFRCFHALTHLTWMDVWVTGFCWTWRDEEQRNKKNTQDSGHLLSDPDKQDISAVTSNIFTILNQVCTDIVEWICRYITRGANTSHFFILLP